MVMIRRIPELPPVPPFHYPSKDATDEQVLHKFLAWIEQDGNGRDFTPPEAREYAATFVEEHHCGRHYYGPSDIQMLLAFAYFIYERYGRWLDQHRLAPDFYNAWCDDLAAKLAAATPKPVTWRDLRRGRK